MVPPRLNALPVKPTTPPPGTVKRILDFFAFKKLSADRPNLAGSVRSADEKNSLLPFDKPLDRLVAASKAEPLWAALSKVEGLLPFTCAGPGLGRRDRRDHRRHRRLCNRRRRHRPQASGELR